MLEALITRYGLLALFIGAGLEGETAVVIGGLLAHHGYFPLPSAIAAATAGSFLADQVFFAVGRRFRDHPRVRRLATKQAFGRAMAKFERHPSAFVFAFRFLYGLRILSPIAIGTSNLPIRRFVLLNAVAALIWATIFITLGYFFGQGAEALLGRLHNAAHLLSLGAGAGAFAIILSLALRTASNKPS